MKTRCVILAFCALLSAACDSAVTVTDGELVVQAVFRTGEIPPEILVSETVAPDDPAFTGVNGANLSVLIDGQALAYERGPRPGSYLPVAGSLPLRAGATYELSVISGSQSGTASGRLPPELRLLGARLIVPEAPVEAILLDSLSLPLDSLSLHLPSSRAFLYAIGVELRWERAPGDFWMESRIDPDASFSSRLIDFFLLTKAILPESEAAVDEAAPELRKWEGVYAIPVDAADSPLPAHELRIALVRGDEAYARFALSSGRPNNREPIGNVDGSLGLVTAISIDTLRLQVP